MGEKKANGAAPNGRGNFCSLKWPLRRKQRVGCWVGWGTKWLLGEKRRGGEEGGEKRKERMKRWRGKEKKKQQNTHKRNGEKKAAGGGVVAALFGLSQPFPGIRQRC